MSAMLFFMEFVDMIAMALAQLGGEFFREVSICVERSIALQINPILIIVKELCSTIRST